MDRQTLFITSHERANQQNRAIVIGQQAACDVLEGFCPACRLPLANGFCNQGCGRWYEARATENATDVTVSWVE